jgi:pimeloyl-ACP methyl ester carboxylesterase
MLIDTRAEADSPEGRQGRDAMIQLARTEGSAAIAAKMMPKMMVQAGETQPQIAAEVRKIMEQCPSLTIEHALAAMRDRADYSGGLPSIVAPTLIIVGDADPITPPAAAEAMHRAIAGSSLSVISSASHLACAEQPQQVNRAIKNFLRTLGT